MAEAAYMVCCQSKAIDRDTGLISLFQVIEGLTITVSESAQAEIADPTPSWSEPNLESFHIVAVWMKNEDDQHDDIFEWELRYSRPDGEMAPAGAGEFSFRKFKFFRINSKVQFIFSAEQSGILAIECKLRKTSQLAPTEWISQTFKIPVSVVRVASSQDDATPDA